MVETLLLAVGQHDDPRLEDLVDTAATVVDPDGTVEVLHVFERDRYEAVREQLNVAPDSEVTPDDVAGRQGNAAQAAERLTGRGVDVTVRGALGDATDGILRTADEVGADVIVVGGRQRSQTGKLLFGSTAQEVLIQADQPVTFVKGREADAAESGAVAEA